MQKRQRHLLILILMLLASYATNLLWLEWWGGGR